jgi:hypothetical protein
VIRFLFAHNRLPGVGSQASVGIGDRAFQSCTPLADSHHFVCMANWRAEWELALAFAGDTALAQALAEDLAKRSPEDTQFNYPSTIHAQLAWPQRILQRPSRLFRLPLP